MRVPLHKVYRAFPELDRFTDEQCARFVRAACRRGWRRHFHRLGVLVAVLAGAILGMAGAGMVISGLDERHQYGYGVFLLVSFAALAVALGLASLPVLALKDLLLRRRIRFILRDRAVCPSCRYSLLGMVVGEGNLVLCPECGMEVEADPSLNELVTDGGGRVLFRPSERIERAGFWTPRRVRRATRGAKVGAVLLLIALPAGLGGYELLLRRQAARAAAERPGARGVLAFVESHQMADTASGDANAWDALYEVVLDRQPIDDAVSARLEDRSAPAWEQAQTDYQTIYEPRQWDEGDERTEKDERNKRFSLALLDAYRDAGLLDRLDAIADVRRAVEPIASSPNQPLFLTRLPILNDERRFAGMNAARMHLAPGAGDREEFLHAYETTLALARMSRCQAALMHSLVGLSLESFADSRARGCILRHPDGAWLDGIEAAMARQDPRLPPAHMVEGERLYVLDAVAWAFADPDRVRMGRFSQLARNGIGPLNPDMLTHRLGTYTENRDAVNASFDAAAAAVTLEPFQRPPLAGSPPDLALLDMLMPDLRRSIAVKDERDAGRRATRIMIALERYFLVHGEYPETLDALVPGQLGALPVVPWTGGPFWYACRGEAYELRLAPPGEPLAEAGPWPAPASRDTAYGPAP